MEKVKKMMPEQNANISKDIGNLKKKLKTNSEAEKHSNRNGKFTRRIQRQI